jgi:protein-disulfide isomerase
MRELRFAAVLLGLAVLGAACEKKPVGRAPAVSPASGPATGERVRVDFYVMSQCPFGVEVENAIGPVLDKLGAAVDFRLNFIATVAGDTIESLHKEPEVKGDIAQLCAAKLDPQRYFKMVLCQNKAPRQIPDNWESCAKEAGIDTAALGRCYSGEEGKALLRASAKLAEEAKADGSPTMFVAGKPYEGGRKSGDFLRAICGELKDKPPACADVKPAPKVTATILNDARCKPCQQITRIVPQLKSVITGLEMKMVDYGTPEGKKLYADAKVKYLPAVLFDSSLDADEDAAAQLKRYLQPAGSYRQLAIGAKFDPTAEICDNGIDDNGDGKIDCADPTCKDQMACRAETKKRLDVFVMSQCPFGVRALDAVKEVLKNFAGQGVELGVHYIASARGEGFESLHGQPEVDEDLRAVCAMKHYGAKLKYMDYIWCRNPNIRDSEWKACAKDGIDAKVIETCATGPEGKKLLAENIKLAEALNVEASPTWLANNKFTFQGVDAETIKKNLCARNPGLKGCDKTLSGMPTAPDGQPANPGSCGN